MTTRRVRRVCVASMVCLFGMTANAQSEPGNDLRVFLLDQPIISTLDEAPEDIALVTTAIVARLRGANGADATMPIVFAPSLASKMLERTFRYDGFYVETVAVSFIGPTTEPEAGRRLFGTLHFTDMLGRRAATSFGVEYVFDGSEIYVSDISLDLATPPEPEARLYVLSAERATEMLSLTHRNHLEAMAFLAEHALDVNQENGLCDCAIVVANFDRIPGRAQLYASVSDAQNGEKIIMGSHFVMDFEGWRLAVLDGTLDVPLVC